ncbi:MAG: diacylglycerol kinase family lipid kinase [Bacteroidetes bacterium]|nr:diacylglycerol kinase family lipid kinase [Bacteroidota bacterium]
MKKKILFIINPISGVGRHKTVEKLIDEKLDRTIYDYELAYTKAAKHAIDLSKKSVAENFNIVVAVGGDGSVNEVGRSLVGTDSALAILPCGSGNGTARHLNISMNLSKAMQIINKGNTIKIDTFNVNDETAINTAGIGYAAHIAYEFSKIKKRGFSNYLKIAVCDSLKYRSQICEIDAHPQPLPLVGEPSSANPPQWGGHRRGFFFIIDIANGSQWGNNAVIAPHAKNDDGLLDLCIVRDFPFRMFPLMALRLFTRSIHRSKFVEILKVKEVIIRQERDYAHIDGEPVIIGKELKVKVNPLSLKVVVP